MTEDRVFYSSSWSRQTCTCLRCGLVLGSNPRSHPCLRRRLKHWELVSRDVNGAVIGRERFWFRRSAMRAKAWQDGTAGGMLSFLTPLPEGMPPLYTNEVVRVGGQR